MNGLNADEAVNWIHEEEEWSTDDVGVDNCNKGWQSVSVG